MSLSSPTVDLPVTSCGVLAVMTEVPKEFFWFIVLHHKPLNLSTSDIDLRLMGGGLSPVVVPLYVTVNVRGFLSGPCSAAHLGSSGAPSAINHLFID